MSVTVEQLDESNFEVTVTGRTTTVHTVTLPSDYWQNLTAGHVDRKTLIERSFAFLLEREPNTSILRTFDLPVIQQYFPEYERVVRRMLA